MAFKSCQSYLLSRLNMQNWKEGIVPCVPKTWCLAASTALCAFSEFFSFWNKRRIFLFFFGFSWGRLFTSHKNLNHSPLFFFMFLALPFCRCCFFKGHSIWFQGFDWLVDILRRFSSNKSEARAITGIPPYHMFVVLRVFSNNKFTVHCEEAFTNLI